MKPIPALLLLSVLPLSVPAFAPFTPADTNYTGTSHFLAPGLKSAILLRATVDVATNAQGQTGATKENNDFTGYIPIDGRSDSGYVIVNNEVHATSNPHGDGGGMTVFTAHFKDDMWSVAPHPNGNFRSVDFTPVGGTTANCGGGQTPWGTVLTGEEWMLNSNSALRNNGNGFRDTAAWTVTEFNGAPTNRTIPRFQNMNWIVEVDVVNAVALKKQYNMGRRSHEGGYPSADGKTVYMMDDATPAAFFKFVSDTVGNYDKGQLYAYQQSADGNSGTWIAMPMDLDTMLNSRAVAFRRGATAFTRHEWAVEVDGKVYITETGNDGSGTSHRNAVRTGATLARHLAQRMNSDSSITDYFGRILRFDPATNKLDVFLEGGAASNGLHFSNPDGMTSVTLGNKRYLVIQEDINGTSQGRVPAGVNRNICELFWLEIPANGALPVRDSLKRMLIGPTGAEITGARFTPDGKTMFVNIQHPSSSNAAPYNRSYTLAIWGYDAPTGLVFDAPSFKKSDKVQVEVNRVSRLAWFDRSTDVELFSATGRRLERHRAIRALDIHHLSPGSYFLRFPGGESRPLTID